MSSFSVQVRKVHIFPHPDPETTALACGQVDDYHVVVGKGIFEDNSLAVYIPEQAIVPPEIIAEMGLDGRLAGSAHNKVKAIRLRGEISQGLLYRPTIWPEHWVEGTDVGAELHIEKYEPIVPIHLQGEMEHCASEFIRSYDLENIKRFPDVLEVGERVVVTEKLHGTQMSVGVDRDVVWVTSKGISERGFCLKEDENNTYWKAAKQFELVNKVRYLSQYFGTDQVILFGEVIGVQRLRYGLKPGQLDYRAFDLYIGRHGFLSYDDFLAACKDAHVPTVPVLYNGPHNAEILERLTSGQSIMAQHIREGVVIRAEPKRFHPSLGRVVLKSVSPAYLLKATDEDEVQ